MNILSHQLQCTEADSCETPGNQGAQQDGIVTYLELVLEKNMQNLGFYDFFLYTF